MKQTTYELTHNRVLSLSRSNRASSQNHAKIISIFCNGSLFFVFEKMMVQLI